MDGEPAVDLPDLVVDPGPGWVRLKLGPNKQAWADQQARALLGARVGRPIRDALATRLVDAAELAARFEDAWSAFQLLTGPELTFTALVRFVCVETDPDDPDAVITMAAPPEFDYLEAPELAALPTPAGTAQRVRARLIEPAGGVGEFLSYIWTFPGRRWAVVATTAFVNPVDAQRWRPVCDQLAAGVRLADRPAPRRAKRRPVPEPTSVVRLQRTIRPTAPTKPAPQPPYAPVGPAVIGERFDSLLTHQEEAWLSGTGPEPPPAGAGAAPRAPLMLPGPTVGASITCGRANRIWVSAGSALRVQATWAANTNPPSTVTGVNALWWVTESAVEGCGLPRLEGDWLVAVTADGPQLAIRTRDWTDPAEYPTPALLQSAGAQAIADALRIPLTVAPTAADARALGPVPRAALARVAPVSRRKAALTLIAPVLSAVVLAVLRGCGWSLAAVTIGAVPLLGSLIADILAVRAIHRRVRSLPGELAVWWPSPRQPAAGIGLRAGPTNPAGPVSTELVLSDGRCFECWLPGPGAGGAVSLLIHFGHDNQPALADFLDPHQQRLYTHHAKDLVGRPDDIQDLARALAPHGLRVSTDTPPAISYPTKRQLDRVRNKARPDLTTGMAGTFLSMILLVAWGAVGVMFHDPLVLATTFSLLAILATTRAVLRTRWC